MLFKKIFRPRNIIISVIGLILLIIIILIIALASIDPNKYKQTIIDAYFKENNRNLILDGKIDLKIHWKLNPELDLTLRNAAIANPPNMQKGNFLSAENITGTTSLFSLLHKKFEFSNIHANNITLNMTEQGKIRNWDFDYTPPGESESSTVWLVLNEIKINNGKINYLNVLTDKKYNFSNLKINYIGKITYNGKQDLFAFSNSSININEIFNANYKFDWIGSNYSGSIITKPFALRSLLKSANYNKLAAYDKPIKNLVIDAAFKGNYNSLNAYKLNIKIGNSSLTGNIKFNSFKPLKLINNFTVDKIDIAEFYYLNGYHFPMRDISQSGNLIIDNRQLSGMQQINVKNITLTGYNASTFIEALNNMSKSIFDFSPILAIKSYLQIKRQIDRFSIKGPKNLTNKTNLGSLKATINLNNNTASIPLKIDGGAITIKGSGKIKFNNRKITDLTNYQLNYFANIQFNGKDQKLIYYLVFPYAISGTLNKPEHTLNTSSVKKQISEFYTKSKAFDTKPESTVTNNINQNSKNNTNGIKDSTKPHKPKYLLERIKEWFH